MSRPLLSVSDHIAPLIAGLRPVAPVRREWKDALSLMAAEDALAPRPAPPVAVALRNGYAVNALDCAGASTQSPAPLPTVPALISTGEDLPPGCDAILEPAALRTGRFGPEALEAVEPGAWVRLPGQDLAAGEALLSAGRRIGPEAILAAAYAGIEGVAVRIPAVSLDWPGGPERDWLMRRIEAVGARLAEGASKADLLIRPLDDDAPKLALAPGSAAWADRVDGVVHLALPRRFDALIGGWCALALPILARLSGAEPTGSPLVLARKIASAVGWTEVALLRTEGGQAHPLAVGDAPLGRLALADSFAILDPESEGAPAGAGITAISLDRPF